MKLVNIILVFIKWPLAVAAAFFTPAAIIGFYQLLHEGWVTNLWKTPFGVGFIIATISWLIVGRSKIVIFLTTMEHEFTHALAAWTTFVPVIELRSTDGTTGTNSLGHVQLGGSNWLILSAPYFFPTVPLTVLIATWVLATTPSGFARFFIGAATAYSILSTWREMHFQQSDLREIGFPFAILFLPYANLLCIGLILANQLGGSSRAGAYSIEAIRISVDWIRM